MGWRHRARVVRKNSLSDNLTCLAVCRADISRGGRLSLKNEVKFRPLSGRYPFVIEAVPEGSRFFRTALNTVNQIEGIFFVVIGAGGTFIQDWRKALLKFEGGIIAPPAPNPLISSLSVIPTVL